MPIFSNLYSNLARQGLHKSVTHGYIQSIAASAQQAGLSTYSNQQRPELGRRASRLPKLNHQFQNAFQTSTTSVPANPPPETHVEKRVVGDAGLDAYFDAWKHQQQRAAEGEKEWKQFQFTKCIEWKQSTDAEEFPAYEEPEIDIQSLDPTRATLTRAFTASDVDNFRKTHTVEEEAAALAQIDAAITEEIRNRKSNSAVSGLRGSTPISRPVSPHTVESATERSPLSSTTTVSVTASAQSESYAEHLMKLADAQRYVEIPAVFEAMLVAGIKPTANAYNALLSAAIYLPAEKLQIIPKALDVYADMLRRKVSPNAHTYNTLVQLLAARSLEISSLKRILEAKRVRFGGMEEAGKFMFASNELEYAILAEDDRLDLAVKLFDASRSAREDRAFTQATYSQLISACAGAGRVSDMIRMYEHMQASNVIPLTATFPPMINGFAMMGDLSSAVDYYNKYKSLAVAHDNGDIELSDRHDAPVYAAVVKAYIDSDKLAGAELFYKRIMETYASESDSLRDVILSRGFVQGMLDQGVLPEALGWAEGLQHPTKALMMSKIATIAADKGDSLTAHAAFEQVPLEYDGIVSSAMAMLAMNIRDGDVAAAQRFWQILCRPEVKATSAFIEPTAMYAVALIGSGHVEEGLSQANQMFSRIRASNPESGALLAGEIEEGIDVVSRFMAIRGISAPQQLPQDLPTFHPAFVPMPFVPVAPAFENSFDPYAASTDFKGSALIIDELERGMGGRAKSNRLREALTRFRNMRRAGRHPRYITYAKLIAAAARDDQINLVHDILGMARTDVPLLPEYPVVRYGWVSILDAMVGACLTLGKRDLAGRYHQELLDMGAAPTANTYGLYITTLKESAKTFDEATEAVKIFHRAKSEGVEPSSFLYNALIGKLGKARRIDDCLFYFAEMRGHGIAPTSVTYGTIVNALCRVSDEKFAEELFEEMESMPNYKARPAPYNSLMQFFLTTKRDKAKVLAYYDRMQSKGIQPTNHTYKLLVDTHATLEPVNMAAAEAVLDMIRQSGDKPETVHYSSLIHAKGCVLHDMDGARAVFDSVLADSSIRPQACLYQALLESMVANHLVSDSGPILGDMRRRGVEVTPYIANTLIHGWANEKKIERSKDIFDAIGLSKREPSTYEAMTRAYLAVSDREGAKAIVAEMMSRGYPGAVAHKISDLVGGGHAEAVQL
jgi:pentatricopeptide repeat protein